MNEKPKNPTKQANNLEENSEIKKISYKTMIFNEL